LAAAGLATGLSWEVLRTARAGTRRAFAVLSGVVAIDLLLFVTLLLGEDRGVASRWFSAGSLAIRATFLLLVAAIGLRLRSAPAGTWLQARGWTQVALSLGIWTTCNIAANFAVDAFQGDDVQAVAYAAPLALLLVVAPRSGPGEAALGKRLFLVLAATTLVGLATGVVNLELGVSDSPIYGITRAVGAVLLVLAVIRGDVLQVPLPRIAVRRGAIATGALALLFIVAQVAQNFFSAEYGLLMGGVLAGGFVFAASPLQRAIERSGDRQKPGSAAPASAVVAYKAALRAAMRDGTLTRREERHLAEAAVALGISPVQALDLRDAVEREPGSS
jgi:hypothetical protein